MGSVDAFDWKALTTALCRRHSYRRQTVRSTPVAHRTLPSESKTATFRNLKLGVDELTGLTSVASLPHQHDIIEVLEMEGRRVDYLDTQPGNCCCTLQWSWK